MCDVYHFSFASIIIWFNCYENLNIVNILLWYFLLAHSSNMFFKQRMVGNNITLQNKYQRYELKVCQSKIQQQKSTEFDGQRHLKNVITKFNCTIKSKSSLLSGRGCIIAYTTYTITPRISIAMHFYSPQFIFIFTLRRWSVWCA